MLPFSYFFEMLGRHKLNHLKITRYTVCHLATAANLAMLMCYFCLSNFVVSMLLPFSPTLYVIIPVMFIQGIPMGFLDNG